MTKTYRLVWGLFFLSAFARPASALPRPAAEEEAKRRARALFHEAARDEDAGRWGTALEKFERVRDFKQTAGVEYHIALCEEGLGHLAVAQNGFIAAADLARRDRAEDVLRLATEKSRALDARVGRIMLVVPEPVAGEEVRIDDAPVADVTAGRTVAVDPGEHVVVATAPDHLPVRTTVTAPAGGTMTVRLELRAAPPVSVGPPRPNPPAESTAPVVGSLSEPASGKLELGRARLPDAAPLERPPSHLPLWLGVGAAALAGAGVTAFVIAGAVDESYTESCKTSANPCTGYITTVRAIDATALTAWIGAAALTTTAVVLFATKNKRSARVSVRPNGLTVEGAF